MDNARIHGRHGERLLASPLRFGLVPLWCPFRLLVALRNVAYDHHLCRIVHLGVPVISVGNITAGGTGKTPLVAAIGACCRRRGRRVAVLSRGYGADPGKANDEARALDLPVHCDPDRRAGARRALAEGADCLILDDGFQHRRIHRDLDLVCIDATRPFGREDGGPGAILPLGLLREPLSSLRRADALIITRSDQIDEARQAELERRLAHWGKPIFRARHVPRSLWTPKTDLREEVATLGDRPVVAVSGLGNPLGFERSLTDLGARLVGRERFGDHHDYTAAEAGDLAARVAAAHALLVTTAKDAVKLLEVLPSDLDFWVLEVDLHLDDDAALEALVDRCLQAAEPLSSSSKPPRSGNL